MRANKLALSTVALMLLSLSAWAGDKMKAQIQIDQRVQVASVQLAPGQYTMTWTENGSNAEVTFSRGKKVIVTVPAHVTQARSGYDSPALHTYSDTNTLTQVELPKESFTFSSENAGPVHSSN